MKNSIGKLLLISLIITSCSKTYDKLEKNPNSPESVPASVVLNNVGTSFHFVITITMETRNTIGVVLPCPMVL
jgi:hypothetical protein